VANCLILLFQTWGGSAAITPPTDTSGAIAPTWPLTDGAITQDQTIQWENVGPFNSYGSWITVAEVTITINDAHDQVKLTLSGQTTTSNMNLSDKAQVRFLNVNTGAQIVLGKLSVSAGGSGADVSGESAPVILRKTMTGLSGSVTLAAQVRALNGSNSGVFAFSVDSCDFVVEDVMK
jgi:hypothetical protein